MNDGELIKWIAECLSTFSVGVGNGSACMEWIDKRGITITTHVNLQEEGTTEEALLRECVRVAVGSEK